jgi:hypothetical protein
LNFQLFQKEEWDKLSVDQEIAKLAGVFGVLPVPDKIVIEVTYLGAVDEGVWVKMGVVHVGVQDKVPNALACTVQASYKKKPPWVRLGEYIRFVSYHSSVAQSPIATLGPWYVFDLPKGKWQIGMTI